MKDINLDKNQEYEIQLYPGIVRLDGKYIGSLRENHIFENQGSKEKNYILIRDQWLEQRERVITHKNTSSVSVRVVPERDIFMINGLQEIIESK